MKVILRWLFWRLKKSWKNVSIILRGDGCFYLPEIIEFIECQNVQYAFEFSSNTVFKIRIYYLLDKARLNYYKNNQKVPLFDNIYSLKKKLV
ncbi:MAG: transposase [Trichodesmium sp. St16_bin4-tuft]|nr:transposase [Trichodesmium sp. MAG_R01]MDE5072740.1 transposase [Trichodesmium sp. St5_bin8]MDE5077838.1 transposase [Trichodesmium sp. St2_bin6]MDE5098839.1 transposase [Trichodesmium sp. St16_bin4-tuft]MDE5104576.1 transposase [Trichodesmium sp. St19_bin2]